MEFNKEAQRKAAQDSNRALYVIAFTLSCVALNTGIIVFFLRELVMAISAS